MNKVEQEVLIKHKRETRMQSFGMVIGIALSMFVAMTAMDLIKEVQSVKIFIAERQNMPNTVLQKAMKRLVEHADEDSKIIKSLDSRITALEKNHE